MRGFAIAASKRRPGFTLVEILVALGIMLILAMITVAFVPRMAEKQRTARAADQLQGWLLIARQWARRDGVPTGIRIQPGIRYPNPATANTGYRTDLQYIQAAQPYYAGSGSTLTVSTSASGVSTGTVSVGSSNVDFFGGYGPTPQDYSVWIVQKPTSISVPIDYLEITNGGPVYGIISISSSNPMNPNLGDTLTLSRAVGSSGSSQTFSSYRIFRAPRIIPGEPALQLPDGTAIDITTNTTYSNSLPVNPATGNIDILFGPSGDVIGQGPTSNKIALWVRDMTQDVLTPGEQTLVTVYVRTGLIAAHPVDTSVNTTLAANVSAGTNVQVLLQDNSTVAPGAYLVLGVGTANQETELVTAVNGKIVTLAQVLHSHASGKQVISDPYSFTRDGRTSGL
jgi:prepilin-type N-terminal cleavage/methylation domain-containing protein